MPWKGVSVSEQRQRFIEDYLLNFYSKTELAERFGVSRKTAHKWIKRYKEHGPSGLQEQSRWPHSCPWQTDEAIVNELVKLKQKHPSWGPAKLLDIMFHRDPGRQLPAISTAARILKRAGLVKSLQSAVVVLLLIAIQPGKERREPSDLAGALRSLQTKFDLVPHNPCADPILH